MKKPIPFLLLLAACTGTSLRDLRVAEDLRESDSFLLRHTLYSSKDPELRARAALAMGRIQSPSYLPDLITAATRESDPVVLRVILFALGQMAFGEEYDGDPRGADNALAAHRTEFDPATRQAVVEALGKLGGPRAAESITEALRDSAPEVRGEAAIALFRLRFMPVWAKRAKEPPPLPPAAVNALVDAADDPEEEVRWRVAYALARYGEPAAVQALRKLAADSNVWARLFAVRALGRSKSNDALESLRLALQDSDAMVRTEAVQALERLQAWNALAEALAFDPSFHVRAALARALGAKEAGKDEILEKLSRDASLTVRCDAIASRARRGDKEAATRALSDPHWKMRKTAAGIGDVEVAEKAWSDPDRRVRAAAVESLGALEDERSAALIRRALEDADLAVRIAGVSALAKRKDLPRLELLRACYAKSQDRAEVELREEIVGAAEDLPEFLRALLADPATSVRAAARKALRARGETVAPESPEKRESSPFLDVHFLHAPVVVLETERGTVEIECLSAEAPVHVASFIELVRRGFYDGLIFHRVVSNFVVQGGDPRGDGSGDAGYNLRDEINRTRYVRGMVGMPKAGKDTGGCQIFVTHTPTPHLDGNYTVFGRVVTGLEVADRIEEGDRILKARIR